MSINPDSFYTVRVAFVKEFRVPALKEGAKQTEEQAKQAVLDQIKTDPKARIGIHPIVTDVVLSPV